MNLGEIKDMALQLIDEYSSNGELISDAENADVLSKMTNLANKAQAELSKVARIEAVHSFTQKGIENLLGTYATWDIVQYTPDEELYFDGDGAKAYYFEVDGPGTVYIEEVGGSTLATITVPDTVTTFTAYKGLVSPSSDTAKVRMRFAGDYVYNTKNRALYPYTFPSADDVPQWKAYNEYDLPSDFWEISKLIRIGDTRRLENFRNYQITKKKLYLNRFEEGEFRLYYWKKPTLLSDDTDVPEIPEEYHYLIAHYVAAMVLIARGETSKGTLLLNVYETDKYAISDPEPEAFATVQDVIGW